MERLKFLLILAAMPDEAFSWVLVAADHAFPDGLGGFLPASRASIVAMQEAGAELEAIMRSKPA